MVELLKATFNAQYRGFCKYVFFHTIELICNFTDHPSDYTWSDNCCTAITVVRSNYDCSWFVKNAFVVAYIPIPVAFLSTIVFCEKAAIFPSNLTIGLRLERNSQVVHGQT